MPAICAVCKKEPVPFDKTRSFHNFPKNSDLKKKWMEVLGMTSVKSWWKICSDHFSESSFHEKNGYNNIRRLLSNALPHNPANRSCDALFHISNNNAEYGKQNSLLTNELDDIQRPHVLDSCHNTCTGTNIVDSSFLENEDIETNTSVVFDVMNDETNLFTDREECVATISELHPQQACPPTVRQNHDTLVTSDTSNRVDTDDVQQTRAKRYRFKIGYAMKCLSRTDFVSDEAWKTFLECVMKKDKQLRAARTQVLRKNRRIESFKELIAVLKKKKQSSVI